MRIGIAEDSGPIFEGLQHAARTASARRWSSPPAPPTSCSRGPRSSRSTPPSWTCACRPSLTDEGLRIAEQLAASHPKVGILILSAHDEIAYASRLFADGTARRGYPREGPRRQRGQALKRRAASACAGGESVVDDTLIGHLLARQRHLSMLERASPSVSELDPASTWPRAAPTPGIATLISSLSREDRRVQHRAHLHQAQPDRVNPRTTACACSPCRPGCAAPASR